MFNSAQFQSYADTQPLQASQLRLQTIRQSFVGLVGSMFIGASGVRRGSKTPMLEVGRWQLANAQELHPRFFKNYTDYVQMTGPTFLATQTVCSALRASRVWWACHINAASTFWPVNAYKARSTRIRQSARDPLVREAGSLIRDCLYRYI